MSTEEERIQYAISRTEVVRPPKQTLSTFGTTNIYYYLITEPAYREVLDGPQETVVSVFLNIFDVHVNRAPIGGKVVEVEYKPGKFLVASRDEASVQNEMNTITIDGRGTVVRFSQIAGLIARRVVCYKKPGEFVTAGERIGLIRFGSRVDVHLGPEWRIRVKEGERVRAGSSILAELAPGE